MRRGFSLIECVIAIGLVVVLLTTFMAIFAPAQQNINRALGVADANRLVTTLETEMAVLRPGEENEQDYNDSNNTASAFQKAFQWIKESDTPSKAVIVYQYQALPDEEYEVSSESTGLLEAVASNVISDDTKIPGVDYISQTVARRVDINATEDFLDSELQSGVVTGNVYAVKMTQLVSVPGDGLVLGNPGEIVNTDEAVNDGAVKVPVSSAEFVDAYITVQVEFYQLPTNSAAFVTGGSWDFESLGAPVATQNIAVRR